MAANDDTPAETQTMTIRLPRDIHERLRREAFDQRTSMNAIIASELEQRYREPDIQQEPEPVIMTHEEFEAFTTKHGIRWEML